MISRSEVKEILEDVAKGLVSIPFPQKQAQTKQPEEIKLHYCAKCQKYHRAP